MKGVVILAVLNLLAERERLCDEVSVGRDLEC